MRRWVVGVCALFTLGGAAYLSGQVDPQPRDPEEIELEERWIASLVENGFSHASGGRPELGPVILGNPTQAVVVLRVGLFYPAFSPTGAVTSEFSTLHHPSVTLSNTAGVAHVLDRSDGTLISVMQPGDRFDVHHDGTGYVVSRNGQPLGTFTGPVLVRPTQSDDRLRVESIRRSNILGLPGGSFLVPSYRGAIEVARGPATPAGRVNVVNIIPLEAYVPGVVVNESPAFFHIEALKTQATAARGYAVANIGRFVRSGLPFDIVDSAASQVYRGVISEHPRGLQAAAETLGLVASYDGRIISALYSSSFGGHSESNEWIFPFPAGTLPGANAEPYLRGIYDGTGAPPNFADPAALAAFWQSQQPQTFDSCAQVNNRFSRWRIVVPAATIKARLPGRIVVTSGDPATVLTGNITNVEVVRRMAASARIAVVRVTLTTGVVEVRGWDFLRFVFGRTAATTTFDCGSAVGANFTLNNPSVLQPEWNADGTLRQVIAWGGGWGHNVGFSQFGAHGRGRAGQSFLQILQAYYTGVDIGAYPIDIGRDPGAGPPTLRQTFFAPEARGTLVVRPRGLKKLVVHFNEQYDLVLDEAQLAAPVVRIDVSPYLLPGVNVVQYNPVGRDGEATVTVVISS
ncbi:MAG TPA: SpoIID/LytB domain-containing protein [Vicinamibacterales bacterium]|nr:SpoIID/LytB domain-containing protein [Vicinamibacterales bacterium]